MTHSVQSRSINWVSGVVGSGSWADLAHLSGEVFRSRSDDEEFGFQLDAEKTSQTLRDLEQQVALSMAQIQQFNISSIRELLRVAYSPRASFPLWFEAVSNPESTKSIAGLSKTIEDLLEQLGNDGAASVGAYLDRVDPARANNFQLIAILRALFAKRDEVPGWRSLERRTRTVLAAKLNVDIVMKGLSSDAPV